MSPNKKFQRSHQTFTSAPQEGESGFQEEINFQETERPSMLVEGELEEPRRELIEYITPSQMRPDPTQPRVSTLPIEIRTRFWGEELSPYEAAQEFIDFASTRPQYQERIDRLFEMGASFQSEGQINPITGYWDDLIFRIETGEQRYWAAIIYAIKTGMQEEPLLRVSVIQNFSVYRQILENRHHFETTAVTQAREIAKAIIYFLKLPTDGIQVIDGYEIFRIVLDKDGYFPPGMWQEIEKIMGLSRKRMVQLLQILRMPSQLLDLADTYDIPDTTLRKMMRKYKNDPKAWEKVLPIIAVKRMTEAEVEGMSDDLPDDLPDYLAGEDESSKGRLRSKNRLPADVIAYRGIRRFFKTISRNAVTDATAIDRVADSILTEDPDDVKAMIKYLRELTAKIQQRVDGK